MNDFPLNQEIVAESHLRCINSGLSNENIFSKVILTGKDLEDVLYRNKFLISIAEPFMKILNDFVKSSNFLTILTDNKGIILRIFGNDVMLKEASNLKMVPGASMAEKDIGTNAMGMVLHHKKPLQLVSNDHFIKAYHRWTCSCAPVFDVNGDLIATLDLTGDVDFVHAHTLGMVVAASYALSNALKVKKFQDKILESKINLESIFNSIPYAIISSDLSGRITFFNSYFVEYFGYSPVNIQNKKMWDFFEGWNEIIDTLNNKQQFLDVDVKVTASKNVLYYSLSAYPKFGYDNELNEIIFVFKDIKKERKNTEKLVFKKAIYTFDKIVTENKRIKDIIEFCKKISDSKSTVLITGESGTGKEVIAQSIHNYSQRKDNSFIAVNCGALPKTLIESELFGYDEGSFTGAIKGGKPGKFEEANSGTIFLDEIGEMPLDMQTNLLRVIEESYITRVGSSIPIPVNIRIIAATNKDLFSEVERGTFRKDLYYRLNVLPVYLPPLRERISDIPFLVSYFMTKLSKKLNKKPVNIHDDYMSMLMEYNWNGNIRELENFVEMIINTEKLPDNIESNKHIVLKNNINVQELHFNSLKDLEKSHIMKVLKHTDTNIMKSAKLLGISRNTLYKKINDYSIVIDK